MERYLAAADEAGIGELGCSEHVYRFTDALEIWRHPFWEEQARDDLDAYCEFVRTTPLRLGLEVDFVPGAEDRIANLSTPATSTTSSARSTSWAIGRWTTTATTSGSGTATPMSIWRRYFETLAEAARSGLFDVLAHPDLVKMWGRARPHPERDPRFYYEPVVEAIAESGVAVEVSTAGLRKPVEEIYPAPALAEDVRRGRGSVQPLLGRPRPRRGGP